MAQGKIVAITNQKGGVGKTTTAVNLSASLAAVKHRVLLIDLDPQANATGGSGIDKKNITMTSKEMLLSEASVTDVITTTPWGYDIIPASSYLTVAEVLLLNLPDRERTLAKQLAIIKEQYDYILIDCPPSLNTLTVNALVASNSVLVPVQCEYYALEGLTSLLSSIDAIRSRVNQGLMIEGLLRTMYDGRNRLTVEVSDQLLYHFKEKVYQTVIPRNIRLAEAPSHGMPIIFYDRSSQGAASYLALAGEILQRSGSWGQKKEQKEQKEA